MVVSDLTPALNRLANARLRLTRIASVIAGAGGLCVVGAAIFTICAVLAAA